jgi:hypothetical protein
MEQTSMELPEEIKNKLVKDVQIEYNKISISFHDTELCITLFACAECCSRSYFDFSDDEESFITQLTNTTINDIITDNGDECYDEKYKDDNECIQVIKIKIINNVDNINFNLVNSSNGYYSGWLEVRSG